MARGGERGTRLADLARVVVITGGTRGIGLAIARLFCRRGWRVAVTFRRSRRAATSAVRVLEDMGGEVVALKADAGDGDAMAEAVREIGDRWGRVDVAVHNAASGVVRPLVETDRYHWEYTLGINSYGLVALTRAVLPWFPAGSGSIVAVSSLGAFRAFENYGVVGSSKAAMEACVRQLARELGPRGVRVNVVSAGPVDTDALRHFPNRADLLRDFLEKNPLHRALEPDDVAAAVWFLASSRMVNGQTLVVDGGFSIMG